LAAAPAPAPGARRPAPPRARRDEEILLDRVHEFWIEGVLDRSLRGDRPLELGKDERLDAVDRGFELTVERFDEGARPLPPGTAIVEHFDRRQRSLLVLGEPGAGKTVTLLELIRDLLARARG